MAHLKHILFSMALLVGGTQVAHAARVVLEEQGGQPELLVDPGDKPFAIFARFDDLWLVFDDPAPLQLTMPESLVERFGLYEREQLIVSEGTGLRLSFGELPSFHAVSATQENVVRLSPADTSVEQGPLEISVEKQALVFDETEIGRLQQAESRLTGEKYMALTFGSINPQIKEDAFGIARLLPTLSGRVFVGREGQPLQADSRDSLKLMAVNLEEFKSKPSFLEPVRPAVNNKPTQPVQALPTAPSLPQLVPDVQKDVTKQANFDDALEQLDKAIEKIYSIPLPGEKVPQVTPPKAPKASAPPPTKADESKPAAQKNVPLPANTTKKKPAKQTSLPSAFTPKKNALPRALGQAAPLVTKRLFERFDEDKSYLETKESLLLQIVEAENAKLRDKLRLELAQWALLNQRFPEAQGILAQLPKKQDGKPQNEKARLLYGISLLLQNKTDEAQPLLGEPLAPEAHRKLWLAAAYTKKGMHQKADELFAEHEQAARRYPYFMREKLILDQLASMIEVGNFAPVPEKVEQLKRISPDKRLPPAAYYLLGRANLKLGKNEDAEKWLAAAANSEKPEIAARAQYSFIDYLLETDQLGKKQAREHLEQLRFSWRGDDLERNVLYDLGHMYLEREMFREGLERLKYYTTYFPAAPRKEEVSKLMTQTFIRMFLPENLAAHDELSILGMYYDFRELTPPGEQGDELIREMGERLENLGLFERATNLFERQLAYRTQDELEKAHIGLTLAKLYHAMGEPVAGLSALDKTKFAQVPTKLAFDRKLLRGKLHLLAKDYEKAYNAIKDLSGPVADRLRADVAWAEEWHEGVVKMLQPYFLTRNRPENWNELQVQDFSRLAYSFYRLEDVTNLLVLKELYKQQIFDSGLANTINFLLQDLGAPSDQLIEGLGVGNMQAVVERLSGFNKFREKYRRAQVDRVKERVQREFYNRGFRPEG